MDITEIKQKRDKLEADLFDLVYQFIVNTEVTPHEIFFEWTRSETIEKKHTIRQIINCRVKIEI